MCSSVVVVWVRVLQSVIRVGARIVALVLKSELGGRAAELRTPMQSGVIVSVWGTVCCNVSEMNKGIWQP